MRFCFQKCIGYIISVHAPHVDATPKRILRIPPLLRNCHIFALSGGLECPRNGRFLCLTQGWEYFWKNRKKIRTRERCPFKTRLCSECAIKIQVATSWTDVFWRNSRVPNAVICRLCAIKIWRKPSSRSCCSVEPRDTYTDSLLSKTSLVFQMPDEIRNRSKILMFKSGVYKFKCEV